MKCPICGNTKCLNNTSDYVKNFDSGTLTHEYYDEVVCMICGETFHLKLTHSSLHRTKKEEEI